MKKWIVITSIGLSLGFAIALANAEDSSNDPQTSSSQEMKSAKTCTDDNGNTYKKGHKGFDTCMEKKMQSEQGSQPGIRGVTPEHSPTSSASGSSESSY